MGVQWKASNTMWTAVVREVTAKLEEQSKFFTFLGENSPIISNNELKIRSPEGKDLNKRGGYLFAIHQSFASACTTPSATVLNRVAKIGIFDSKLSLNFVCLLLLLLLPICLPSNTPCLLQCGAIANGSNAMTTMKYFVLMDNLEKTFEKVLFPSAFPNLQLYNGKAYVYGSLYKGQPMPTAPQHVPSLQVEASSLGNSIYMVLVWMAGAGCAFSGLWIYNNFFQNP